MRIYIHMHTISKALMTASLSLLVCVPLRIYKNGTQMSTEIHTCIDIFLVVIDGMCASTYAQKLCLIE